MSSRTSIPKRLQNETPQMFPRSTSTCEGIIFTSQTTPEFCDSRQRIRETWVEICSVCFLQYKSYHSEFRRCLHRWQPCCASYSFVLNIKTTSCAAFYQFVYRYSTSLNVPISDRANTERNVFKKIVTWHLKELPFPPLLCAVHPIKSELLGSNNEKVLAALWTAEISCQRWSELDRNRRSTFQCTLVPFYPNIRSSPMESFYITFVVQSALTRSKTNCPRAHLFRVLSNADSLMYWETVVSSLFVYSSADHVHAYWRKSLEIFGISCCPNFIHICHKHFQLMELMVLENKSDRLLLDWSWSSGPFWRSDKDGVELISERAAGEPLSFMSDKDCESLDLSPVDPEPDCALVPDWVGLSVSCFKTFLLYFALAFWNQT